MDPLTKLLELLKIPIRYFIGLFIVDLCAILAPNPILQRFGLAPWREKAKSYLGLIFGILAVMLIARFVGMIHAETQAYIFLRARKKRLNFLTIEEKQILGRYIEGETRSLYLDMRSGVVQGLIDDAVIYKASSVSVPEYGLMAFAFNIQQWAWDYLNEHRDLLSLPAHK